MNRRNFIHKTTGAALAIPFLHQGFSMAENTLPTPSETEPEKDENFWLEVRKLFEPADDFINLENGYFSPQPSATRQYFESRGQYINSHTSWYMRRQQEDARENVREKLAMLAGSLVKETALVRNTTEAMNIIIMGYPWQPGDEVIYSNQDYGSMVEQLQQAQRRYGIVLKKAALPMHPQNDEEIVDAYMQAATPKTKLMLLTHLINLSGQVLPAKKIIERAHSAGIEVLVDAAHSFAHVNCNFNELDADYLGCSLHKWLCNPLGAGMLCIKKTHIRKIWPLYGDTGRSEGDIRKFEHYGTHPCAVYETIEKAIAFHQQLGAALKQNRLAYLTTCWTDKVKDNSRIQLNTPLRQNRFGALANIAVTGLAPDELAARLLKEFNIFTVAINHDVIKGVRITPHLYTNMAELDALVTALQKLAS